MLNGNDLKKGIVIYDSLQNINRRDEVVELLNSINDAVTELTGPLEQRGLIIKSTLYNKDKKSLEKDYYTDGHVPGKWNNGVKGIFCHHKGISLPTNITGEDAFTTFTQYNLLSTSGYNPFGRFSDLKPTIVLHAKETKKGLELFIYRDYHLHDMKGERKKIFKREYDTFVQNGNTFNKTKAVDVQIFQIRIADTTTMYESLKDCFKHSDALGERLLERDLKHLLDWSEPEQQIENEDEEMER